MSHHFDVKRACSAEDSNVTKGVLKHADLRGRVAIITGSSRGIGRECAFALARLGVKVVIAAKTIKPQPTLPGTIFTVRDEVRSIKTIYGDQGQAMAYQLDLRDAKAIEACVEATVKEFGRIDILVNNASALWWQDIVDTPAKKYDLITQINARGTFLMTRACLPHMVKNDFGRVITMSPPIVLDRMMGHTAYNISKFGMTMVALGVAQEYEGEANITGNSLWPATVVESLASINFKLGDKGTWRKATVLSDAVVSIVSQSQEFSGNMLIDDTYLLSQGGLVKDDLKVYRCDPNFEPPRVLDVAETRVLNKEERGAFKRGDASKVTKDMEDVSTNASKAFAIRAKM